MREITAAVRQIKVNVIMLAQAVGLAATPRDDSPRRPRRAPQWAFMVCSPPGVDLARDM